MAELERLDRLQRLREVLAQSRHDMVEARRQLGQLTARAESRDGMIVVVLDASGQLAQLEFRGDIHRDLEGHELSNRILAVSREAQEQLRRGVVELMPRSPWGEVSLEEMLDPETDLDRLLPKGLFDLTTASGAMPPPSSGAEDDGSGPRSHGAKSRAAKGARGG
jgi:DNA-binding protein YbaB